MLTAARNLVSIGRAARTAGVDVQRFAEAAQQIGVTAAETIDDVPLLARPDAQRVIDHLGQQEANR